MISWIFKKLKETRQKRISTANMSRYDELSGYSEENKANETRAEFNFSCYLAKNYGGRVLKQHVIGSYIVDFYIPERFLVIEIDGGYHKDNQLYDQARDYYMEGLGLATVRILNEDVKTFSKKRKMRALIRKHRREENFWEAINIIKIRVQRKRERVLNWHKVSK